MSRKYHDEEWLRQKYHEEEMTQGDIAEECNVDPTTITKWMGKLGIEARDHSEKYVNPERRGCTEAGFLIAPDGYAKAFSWNRDRDQTDFVSIHQLVAIAYGADPYRIFDGRNTVVHHDNEWKSDNRPENLVVTSNEDHARYHAIENGFGRAD